MRAARHSVPPTEWNIESSRKLASIDYPVGGNFIGVHGWHRAERRFSSNRAKTRRRLASVLSILSITPRVRLKTLPAAVETFERRTRSPQPELTREAREEAREGSRGTFERDPVREISRDEPASSASTSQSRDFLLGRKFLCSTISNSFATWDSFNGDCENFCRDLSRRNYVLLVNLRSVSFRLQRIYKRFDQVARS